MTLGNPSTTDRLVAVEEIKSLFAARLRAMDNKNWSLYPSFHTDDVVSETWSGLPEDKQPSTGEDSGRVVGPENLTAAIRGMLDGPRQITSVHHGHTPEITLTSETTATGVWAMEDRLWWTSDGGEEHLHGFGHYHEEYRKVDGTWLISYRKLTRMRVENTPHFFDYLEAL